MLTMWTAVTCASQNIAQVLVFRCLSGLFGSSPLSNAGGTIADVLDQKQRGIGMGKSLVFFYFFQNLEVFSFFSMPSSHIANLAYGTLTGSSVLRCSALPRPRSRTHQWWIHRTDKWMEMGGRVFGYFLWYPRTWRINLHVVAL